MGISVENLGFAEFYLILTSYLASFFLTTQSITLRILIIITQFLIGSKSLSYNFMQLFNRGQCPVTNNLLMYVCKPSPDVRKCFSKIWNVHLLQSNENFGKDSG